MLVALCDGATGIDGMTVKDALPWLSESRNGRQIGIENPVNSICKCRE
jgi:hypothetical protein